MIDMRLLYMYMGTKLVIEYIDFENYKLGGLCRIHF